MGANEKHAATYHGGEYTPNVNDLAGKCINDDDSIQITPEMFDRAIAKIKAEAWDACARSIVYEDGTPVEIMSLTNPYK